MIAIQIIDVTNDLLAIHLCFVAGTLRHLIDCACPRIVFLVLLLGLPCRLLKWLESKQPLQLIVPQFDVPVVLPLEYHHAFRKHL